MLFGTLWVEAKDAVRHSRIHRTTPPQNYPIPNVSGADTGKLCLADCWVSISKMESLLLLLLLQWASLIAQLVKSPLAMQETRVQFLGWEDLLEKG